MSATIDKKGLKDQTNVCDRIYNISYSVSQSLCALLNTNHPEPWTDGRTAIFTLTYYFLETPTVYTKIRSIHVFTNDFETFFIASVLSSRVVSVTVYVSWRRLDLLPRVPRNKKENQSLIVLLPRALLYTRRFRLNRVFPIGSFL